MSKINILLYFTLFVSSIGFHVEKLNAQDLNAEEAAICGKKPESSEIESKLLEQATLLERNMPPVSNQNPASWCFAIVATDSVNYHNYIQTNLQNKTMSRNQFYNDTNMISPIDVVYATKIYTDLNTTPVPLNQGRLDMKAGSDSTRSFLGIQSLGYKMRSLNQIHFNSLEESNQKSKVRIKALIEEYKKHNKNQDNLIYTIVGLSCPALLYEDPIFQNQIYGFEQINSWLLKTAELNKLKVSDYVIDNYADISKLKGEKDIKVYPYITNLYQSSSRLDYLKKLRETLYPNNGSNGYPVSVDLCNSDIKLQASVGITNDECDNHAISVVGAYYKNGKCIVRIRNSKGKDWNTDGHISLPLNKYLKTVEHFATANNLSINYSARWISPENKNYSGEPRTITYDGTGTKKIGVYRREFFDKKQEEFYTIWKNEQVLPDLPPKPLAREKIYNSFNDLLLDKGIK